MGSKRLICILLAITLALGMLLNVNASGLVSINIEQTEAYLPKVITYLSVLDEENNTVDNIQIFPENIEVLQNGEKLNIVSVQKQKDTEYGVNYYYLLDVSTSVSQNTLNQVKKAITEQISNGRMQDNVTVITFGTSVDIVLNGNETADEAAEKLEEVIATQNGTMLHDAVMKVIEIVESAGEYSGNRSVMAVVTDGVDEQIGGVTRKEIEQKIADANIPIFAFGYKNGSSSALDGLGELARSSGGYMELIDAGSAAEKILAVTDRIDNTLRLECEASNNIAAGEKGELTVNIDLSGSTYSAVSSVKYRNHIKDTDAPYIEYVEVTGEEQLKIQFSEPVSGTEKGNIVLKNSKDKVINVEDSNYNGGKDCVMVTVDDTLYSGVYTLELNSVKDISVEANGLKNPVFTFETDKNPKTFGYYLAEYFYIPVILIVIAGTVALILIVNRKKRNESEENDKIIGSRRAKNNIHLEAAEGLAVELAVIDSGKSERKVNTVISGLYIVGRDVEMCELAIDDKRLSRQHFALLYDNGVLKIRDLGSTNGTRINGLLLANDRVLNTGDVIEAGNTKMRINMKQGL